MGRYLYLSTQYRSSIPKRTARPSTPPKHLSSVNLPISHCSTSSQFCSFEFRGYGSISLKKKRVFLGRHKTRDVESHLTPYVLRRSSLGRHGNKPGNQFPPMWSTYPEKMLAYQSGFHPYSEEGLAIADWNGLTLSIYEILVASRL